MSLNIFVTEAATEDALAIAEFLAEQSGLNTSDKFLHAVTQASRQLAAMPGMGVARAYSSPRLAGMRMLRVSGFPRYLIFYQASETELRILRVLHGSQNLHSVFHSPDEH